MGRRGIVIGITAAVGVLALAAVGLLLLLPPGTGGTSHVNRRVADAGGRGQQDIDAAMDVVEQEFVGGHEDCAPTDLWFGARADREPGYQDGYGAENVLVLDSRFATGPGRIPRSPAARVTAGSGSSSGTAPGGG